MASAPHNVSMCRVEPLKEQNFNEARNIFNHFVGSTSKRACGIFPCSCCPTSFSAYTEGYRKDSELIKGSAIAVATDGTVIGAVKTVLYGQFRSSPDQMLHKLKPYEAYIDYLAVKPGHRGQGAGTKLLEWAEKTSRERGARVLTLGVVANNPAIHLYERFGFVKQKGDCCSTCMVFCVFGCPHGACGGYMMEKPL